MGLSATLARTKRHRDAKKNAKTSQRSSFRPDIQGLRAFAVVVVILDHLLHWPNGGFIGVDVFFVISGFLITGHLLREYNRTGHISFVSFYKKRTKRILPAAALVLVTTVVAAYLVFNQARFQETLWDAVWGLFFGANWRFAAVGTDYFQLDGPVSPLQHFWSLAVEEQFYFLWPWLLLLAFFLFIRGDRRGSDNYARVIAGSAIGVVSLLSLGWAIVESSSNPGLAYFSTFSRGWELGVGAALACAVPLLYKLPQPFRPWLAWLGMAGLMASLFVIDESAAFPAPAALLPVLAAAAVIAAGTGGETHRSLTVLTNPVSRYLGDISYSLYLWHFPIIIIGSALFPSGGVVFVAAASAAMLFCAVAAYNLWEDPIRKSGWLEGKPRWWKHIQISDRFKYSGLATLFVVTSCMVTVLLLPPDRGPASPLAATGSKLSSTTAGAAPTVAPTYGPAVAALQNNIQVALSISVWPDLNPAIEELGTEKWVAEIEADGCSDVGRDNVSDCFFATPNATKTAVLYGDSFAMAWSPGIRAALADAGYSLQLLTRGQCPAASVSVTANSGQPFPACDEHHAWAPELIKEIQPDLVIMASAENTLIRLASKASGQQAVEEYAAGSIKTIEAISGSGAAVAVLSTPPRGKNLQECVTKVSTHADCTTVVTSDWFMLRDGERKATELAGGTFIDTHLWFCNDQGVCPAFSGKTPIRADTGHITVEYSTQLSAAILEEVLPRS